MELEKQNSSFSPLKNMYLIQMTCRKKFDPKHSKLFLILHYTKKGYTDEGKFIICPKIDKSNRESVVHLLKNLKKIKRSTTGLNSTPW